MACPSLQVIYLNIDLAAFTPDVYQALEWLQGQEVAKDFDINIITNNPFEDTASVFIQLSGLKNTTFHYRCFDIAADIYFSGNIPNTNFNVMGYPTNLGSPNPRGLLHPRNYMLLFYRQDIAQQHGIGLESLSTWYQLIQALQAVNGTDMDGDGRAEDWGLCLDVAPACKGYAILMSIASSMIVTHGHDQGLVWDPATGKPMLTGPAMKEALAIYQQLRRFTSPASANLCKRTNKEFVAGKCFATISWDTAFRSMNETAVLGRVGVAPLPGSPWVLDRTADVLRPCDSTRCPFAVAVPGVTAGLPLTASSTMNPPSPPGDRPRPPAMRQDGQATSSSPASQQGQQAGAYMLMNRPSFSSTALMSNSMGNDVYSEPQIEGIAVVAAVIENHLQPYAIARRSSIAAALQGPLLVGLAQAKPQAAQILESVFSSFGNSSLLYSRGDSSGGNTSTGTSRSAQGTISLQSMLDLTFWKKWYFHSDDAVRYLAALLQASTNPNAAGDYAAAGAPAVRGALDESAQLAGDKRSPADITR